MLYSKYCRNLVKDIRIAKQLSIDDAEVEEDALKSAKYEKPKIESGKEK